MRFLQNVRCSFAYLRNVHGFNGQARVSYCSMHIENCKICDLQFGSSFDVEGPGLGLVLVLGLESPGLGLGLEGPGLGLGLDSPGLGLGLGLATLALTTSLGFTCSYCSLP